MRIDETEWTPLCEKHYREKISRLTRTMEFRLWLARLALRLCTWLVPSPLLPALLQEDDSPAAEPVPAGSDDGHGYLTGPTEATVWQLSDDFIHHAIPPVAQGPTEPEETADAEPRPARLH